MKTETNPTDQPNGTAKPEKPGFFGRLFTKIDSTLKAKANAQPDCCCAGEKDKDGKSGSNKCC